MKISHSELTQIIKEEIERYKKIKLLENRKQQILRQLNEMKTCSECGAKYEESMEESMEEGSDKMVDEILGSLFKKDPKKEEEKINAMKEIIKKHPTYSSNVEAIAEKYKKSEEEILNKMAQFFAKEGGIADGKLVGIKSFVYNPKDGNFVDRTKISQPYGPAGMEP